MPCNCIVDNPTYPQTEEWGPLVWLILHSYAEKAGKQENQITKSDEQRVWPLIVKNLPPIIPCPYCREHLQQFVRENPFDLPQDYFLWRTFIPDYFYRLHESVNTRLGKPSFPKENLSSAYRDSNKIQPSLTRLIAIQRRAIHMGGVSHLAWAEWLRNLSILRAAVL